MTPEKARELIRELQENVDKDAGEEAADEN